MQTDYSSLALEEIKSAYTYYFNKESKDVADRFENDVHGAVEFVVKFYEANPLIKDSKRKPRNKNRRFIVLNNFNYNIYYRMNLAEKIVHIDRVLHGSRDISSLLKK